MFLERLKDHMKKWLELDISKGMCNYQWPDIVKMFKRTE